MRRKRAGLTAHNHQNQYPVRTAASLQLFVFATDRKFIVGEVLVVDCRAFGNVVGRERPGAAVDLDGYGCSLAPLPTALIQRVVEFGLDHRAGPLLKSSPSLCDLRA